MAKFETHCEDCARELGEDFAQVHLWLDELFNEYGITHRKYGHHVEGVEEIRNRWGDKAARAAEIHIMRDFGIKYVPTKHDVETIWWLYGVL